MHLRVEPGYQELCAAVADEVVSQLRRKPASVLVFPTGNTPLGLFACLVAAQKRGDVDFVQARIVVLDEYAGLEAGDPRCLQDWLRRELLDRVGSAPSQCTGFAGALDATGLAQIERRIAALGGIDLCILGLGPNGHLGFNEPGSAFDSRTRLVDLAPASIASNAAYWGSPDRVPRQGYTLGLGTLAEARSIILMVSGASKQGILHQTVTATPSPAVPASLLQHLPHASVFADAAAAATLPAPLTDGN